MSTKTPKSIIFLTVPSKIIPSLRSLISKISCLNSADLASSRGSRPGFLSSSIISTNVGSPTFNLVAKSPTLEIEVNFSTHLGVFKLYSCKFYENDNMIRNFVPCRDKDGTVCLYDKIEGKYYYNKGTGEFVAGPEV